MPQDQEQSDSRRWAHNGGGKELSREFPRYAKWQRREGFPTVVARARSCLLCWEERAFN